MTKYARAQDMDGWLRDPRIARRGFAHRWQSSVAPGNGEDAFIGLIEQFLHPDCDVLDLGCGHGELTLTIAARCRTMTGIEREPGYLELARELAAERGITNVRFFQVNMGAAEDGGPGIPLAGDSIDLFINRRGPILQRYLAEAIRVARKGAVMVGLHPTGNTPAPAWCDELPEPYRNVFMTVPFEEVTGWVKDPLRAAGISDYSLWWMDVPEFLRSPYELYVRLGGTEIAGAPEYQNVEPQLEKIIKQHGTAQGIILRHQRVLWQAYLPE
jgi:SAM-dependent methyltransferase